MVKIVTDLGAARSYMRGRYFLRKSREMTDTENMMMTNIIGNFIADNIVFEMEVLAHHPEELYLEI